jgi:hypothetical protein
MWSLKIFQLRFNKDHKVIGTKDIIFDCSGSNYVWNSIYVNFKSLIRPMV